MTEPNSNVPDYHDPHGEMGTSDNVARPNEFFDVSVYDQQQPGGENIMFNVEGNNDHPSRWESQNTQFVNDPSQEGPSGVQDQSGGQNEGYFDQANCVVENSTQILDQPVPSLPYDCSYCHVLREIIHKKGEEETTKLEIHGRFGIICHGILEVSSATTTAPYKEYHTFDFCNKSIPDVRNFLVKYFEDRIHAYYTLVDDPLLTFYDALCVQSDWDCVYGDNHQGSQGNIDTNQPEAQSDGPRKRTFKEQKEYAQSVKIKDVAKFFHLREHDAAKHLGISPSTIKKIVHNAGLKRWPYRQVEAIEKRTKEIISKMESADPTKTAEAEEELQRLQTKKAQFSAPFE